MKRERLFQKRKEMSLTQAEVAKKAGIDRTAYTRIEGGKRNPSVEVALKIAHALNCCVEDIFIPSEVTKPHIRPTGTE